MKIKLLALTLLILLLIAPFGQVACVQGTGEEGDGATGGDDTDEFDDDYIDPVVYEKIKLQAEQGYDELYMLMFGPLTLATADSGDDDGPVFPDDVDPAVRNQFIQAWSAMKQAEEKEETDPRAAANQYLRAMKQLRNAFRKYQKDNSGTAGELVFETEGVPEDDIPVESTDEELSDVQEQLVQRFQERFQERVTIMFENYNEVEGQLSPDDAVKAFNALTKAEEKLLRIQEKIDAGKFDEALDDLDDASEEMNYDFNSLEDVYSKQMFKTMNQLEAKIARMVEQAERKAANGQDISEENSLIAQLRGNKDKNMNDFNDNKGKGNN